MEDGKKKAIKGFKDLQVYQEGFALAMEVFKITAKFPREELYSLPAQMWNASRSVPANLAEGWAKRIYTGEEIGQSLSEQYHVLARRLHQLHTNWRIL